MKMNGVLKIFVFWLLLFMSIVIFGSLANPAQAIKHCGTAFKGVSVKVFKDMGIETVAINSEFIIAFVNAALTIPGIDRVFNKEMQNAVVSSDAGLLTKPYPNANGKLTVTFMGYYESGVEKCMGVSVHFPYSLFILISSKFPQEVDKL